MLPFIGNIHLMKPRKELFNQLIEIPKYFPNEPFFCNWIGTYPVVIVHNSNVIEEFFNSSKHTEKVWLYSFVEDWLELKLCTLDIIGETAMGVNLEAQKNLNVEYVKSVDRYL
ncbi:unnamed protein product [Brachionus calyciflorus]|uniref:Uncharacterized protein n=1 Tax=Brachionus calyciflorus TaxID=104777 RepID=A0A814PR72_9BILA|nr:unnamed protein product [Brachionus calyciflorus]